MEKEKKKKKEAPAPKNPLTTYIVGAIVFIVVLSCLVEVYGAFTEGRPLNLEMINKLIDTLTSLMAPPPAPVE